MFSYLIERAKKTPYYDLPGYMRRNWLVPYRDVQLRELTAPVTGARWYTDDNTGAVSFRKRPVAWVLQRCGIAVRVHEILRSDAGRHPHDHPFSYVSIVLKGGYYEARYDAEGRHVSTWGYGPGSVLYRPASIWHKILIPRGEACTTLFITTQKSRPWGFNVKGTKVPHDQYQGADK